MTGSINIAALGALIFIAGFVFGVSVIGSMQDDDIARGWFSRDGKVYIVTPAKAVSQ